jgi:glucose/arabinose dehydrogenase
MRREASPRGLEVVASDLDTPWSMDFLPGGSLVFTERVGRVRALNDGVSTMLELDVKARQGDEGGLLGLAVSPDFASSQLIYLYYTYGEGRETWNRVSRFTLTQGELRDEEVVLDGIPGGRVHNGGRMKFGPDGRLYVTTGETWRSMLAQDLGSLGGKILRINPDGSVPGDNPFKGSPVYSYGNRNPQGLAWHPLTGELFSSEHGPSGENGWYAHDEINIIKPRGNYGWPHVIGAARRTGLVDPILSTGDETWAPSGMCFYTGGRYEGDENTLFVACLRGRQLRAIRLRPPAYTSVESSAALLEGELGRVRDVAQSPDGWLYLCTSNRDGRGNPVPGDDLIARALELPA